MLTASQATFVAHNRPSSTLQHASALPRAPERTEPRRPARLGCIGIRARLRRRAADPTRAKQPDCLNARLHIVDVPVPRTRVPSGAPKRTRQTHHRSAHGAALGKHTSIDCFTTRTDCDCLAFARCHAEDPIRGYDVLHCSVTCSLVNDTLYDPDRGV